MSQANLLSSRGNVKSKGTRGNCPSSINVAGEFLSPSTLSPQSIQKPIKSKGSRNTSVA